MREKRGFGAESRAMDGSRALPGSRRVRREYAKHPARSENSNLGEQVLHRHWRNHPAHDRDRGNGSRSASHLLASGLEVLPGLQLADGMLLSGAAMKYALRLIPAFLMLSSLPALACECERLVGF